MAHMGLRLAQRANGVSLLHGRVSREMFNGLWPGFDPAEVPIGSITNGVHAPTWAAPQWLELGRELAGSTEALREPHVWQRLQQVDSGHIWWIRSQLRAQAGRRRAGGCGVSWLRAWRFRGRTRLDRNGFDPDVLTIGFARRVPTYKRLTLMLRDPERLETLLLDPEGRSSSSSPASRIPPTTAARRSSSRLCRFADRPEVRHRIVFLPDYDMAMARLLYWGCDVWLNNPLRPLEACGTSGMKSALTAG